MKALMREQNSSFWPWQCQLILMHTKPNWRLTLHIHSIRAWAGQNMRCENRVKNGQCTAMFIKHFVISWPMECNMIRSCVSFRIWIIHFGFIQYCTLVKMAIHLLRGKWRACWGDDMLWHLYKERVAIKWSQRLGRWEIMFWTLRKSTGCMLQ